MTEKDIRGGICHSIYRYTKANNKYMKGYYENEESAKIQSWNVSNLDGWAMLQNILVIYFKWTKDAAQFNKDFIKSYNEESDKWYFLKVDVQSTKKLRELYNDLPFLPKIMKIAKVEKLVVSLHDKSAYVIHIKNLK